MLSSCLALAKDRMLPYSIQHSSKQRNYKWNEASIATQPGVVVVVLLLDLTAMNSTLTSAMLSTAILFFFPAYQFMQAVLYITTNKMVDTKQLHLQGAICCYLGFWRHCYATHSRWYSKAKNWLHMLPCGVLLHHKNVWIVLLYKKHTPYRTIVVRILVIDNTSIKEYLIILCYILQGYI